MYKIKIITVGKIKEQWLKMAKEEYEKRLKKEAFITWHLVKNEKKLLSFAENEKKFIALDVKGKVLSSEKLKDLFSNYGKSLSFIIGNDKGLNEKIKKRASFLLSLSKLTFTHQMTRLILLEQIYRTFEIAKGSKYHK